MAKPSIAVTVLANLDEFRAALKSGETAIQTTAGALSKMGNAFDGSKIISQAGALVQAVGNVEDVTKLTTAEQVKLNKTLTEAIEKYEKLGKEAPADMVALKDATAEAGKPVDALGGGLTKIWDGLKSAAGLIGVAFTAGAVVDFTKKVFDAASAIHDQSIALGFSAEAYQRQKYAVEQSGGSVETFTKAVNKLNDNLANGSDSTVAALSAAGLKFAEIRAMKPEEAWLATTEAVGKIEDPMKRAATAQDLFGKGALELLPGMIEGYQKLGSAATVMSDDTVNRLEAAQDAWEAFWNKITIVSGEALGGLMKDTSAAMSGWGKLWGDIKATASGGIEGHRQYMAALAAQSEQDQAKVEQASAKITTATHAQTEAEKKDRAEAVKAIEAHKKAISDLADTYTGKALAKQVSDVTDAYDKAKKEGGLLASQVVDLSRQLEALRQKGSVLRPDLAALAGAFKTTAQTIDRDLKPVLVDLDRQFEESANIWRVKTTDALNAMVVTGVKPLQKALDEGLGPAIKKIEPPPADPWKQFKDDVSGTLNRLTTSIQGEFASILLGAQGFHEAFVGIWNSIKGAVGQIVAEMLSDITGRIFKGLANILSGSGSFGSAFAGLFGGGASAVGGAVSGGGAAAGAAGAGAGASAGSILGAVGGFAAGAFAPFLLGALINPDTGLFGGGSTGTGWEQVAPNDPYGYQNSGMSAADVANAIANGVPGYATGTNGYQDFGAGTLAMLHGREKVTPEGRDVGGGVTLNVYAQGSWFPSESSLDDFADMIIRRLPRAATMYVSR